MEDQEYRLPESSLGGRAFFLGFLSMLSLAGMVGSLFYIQKTADSQDGVAATTLIPFGVFFLVTLIMAVLGILAGVRSLFLRDFSKTLGFAGIGIGFAVLVTLGVLSALSWHLGADLFI